MFNLSISKHSAPAFTCFSLGSLFVRPATSGWFVGKDVAEALGYRDTSDALKKHVDADDKLTRRFADSGQAREMYIINESGLYSVIFTRPLRLLACAGTPESLSTPQPARRRYADRWG